MWRSFHCVSWCWETTKKFTFTSFLGNQNRRISKFWSISPLTFSFIWLISLKQILELSENTTCKGLNLLLSLITEAYFLSRTHRKLPSGIILPDLALFSFLSVKATFEKGETTSRAHSASVISSIPEPTATVIRTFKIDPSPVCLYTFLWLPRDSSHILRPFLVILSTCPLMVIFSSALVCLLNELWMDWTHFPEAWLHFVELKR